MENTMASIMENTMVSIMVTMEIMVIHHRQVLSQSKNLRIENILKNGIYEFKLLMMRGCVNG